MSQENVEIIRNAFDAFSRGDIEAVLAVCDENIVVRQPRELPGVAPEQHGHAGVLEAFAIWPEQWDDYYIEIRWSPTRATTLWSPPNRAGAASRAASRWRPTSRSS